jgi:hypothetical protein
MLKAVDKSMNNRARPHPAWRGGECLKIRQVVARSASPAQAKIAAILVVFPA